MSHIPFKKQTSHSLNLSRKGSKNSSNSITSEESSDSTEGIY